MTTLKPYLTRRNLRIAVALLSALCAALGVSLSLVLTTGGGTGTYTVTLGGAHGTPTSTMTVAKPAADRAAAALEDGLRSEQPAGVSASQLDAARDQQEALAEDDQLPIVTPDAAPEQRGCRTQLVQNYSTRRGVKPREFVEHYTVSPNIPNSWADVYAVAREFDTPAFQASSNYIIDGDGHCLYIVRETDKAWTQAAANPFSISVEVINSGHEAVYLAPAGKAKLAMVESDALARWGIPVQQGLVRDCLVVKPGIVDHASLGACGGGHHDIEPYSVPETVAAVAAFRAASMVLKLPPVSAENAVCTVFNLEKRLGLRPANWKVDRVTRAAIRRLQARFGLAQTGYAGAKVGRALKLRWCSV